MIVRLQFAGRRDPTNVEVWSQPGNTKGSIAPFLDVQAGGRE